MKQLFDTQKLAVIASDSNGQPYANLVAFCASDNLKCLHFATKKHTTKYQNLQTNNKIAVLIDNRENKEQDFEHAITVTALGTARTITKDVQECKTRFTKKHPSLTSFLKDTQTVMIQIDVNSYHIVNQFQQVTTIKSENLPSIEE